MQLRAPSNSQIFLGVRQNCPDSLIIPTTPVYWREAFDRCRTRAHLRAQVLFVTRSACIPSHDSPQNNWSSLDTSIVMLFPLLKVHAELLLTVELWRSNDVKQATRWWHKLAKVHSAEYALTVKMVRLHPQNAVCLQSLH